MEIHCSKCSIYLGEIRDAKLRKNISFLCNACETSRVALEMKETTGYSKPDVFGDIFKDTFNDIFGSTFGKKR